MADEALRQAIEAVMIKNPGYGHRRVADALKINRKRARRVMKLYNLKPARRCRTPPPKPADGGKPAVNVPDITKVLSPIVPGFLWISDFTFISFKGIFVFLATILDRFTAEVLGAAVMTRHTAELPLAALRAALEKVGHAPVWFHSDQGSEYDSDLFRAELAKHGVEVSVSPKASPWRNGAQESFFGRFKVEFGDPDRFDTLPELIEAIHLQVAYYNNERIHTRFRMPPARFKTKWFDSRNIDQKRPPCLAYNERSVPGTINGSDHALASYSLTAPTQLLHNLRVSPLLNPLNLLATLLVALKQQWHCHHLLLLLSF